MAVSSRMKESEPGTACYLACYLTPIAPEISLTSAAGATPSPHPFLDQMITPSPNNHRLISIDSISTAV